MRREGVRPLKIAVDMDDTLCNVTTVVLDFFNFKHGTNLTEADVGSWDWKDNATAWGLDPDVVSADFWRVYGLLDHTHLRRACPPIDPMACASVKWLVKRGYDVHIVTSNRAEAEMPIRSWLFGHGLDVPLDLIGRRPAGEKARLDYDIFIDDSPLLAPAVEAAGKLLLLVPRSCNKEVRQRRWLNVHTGFTWRHAVDIFEELGL